MMKRSHQATDSNLFRLLPSLHDLLQTPGFAALLETEPRTSVVHATREVLSRMQQEIAEGRHTQATLESELEFVHATVAEEIARNLALQSAARHQCHRGHSPYKSRAGSS